MGKVMELIENSIYDNYLLLGFYKNYTVYEPFFNNDDVAYISFPEFILERNNIVRWTTREESEDIYDKLIINT